jgi:glycosyltransferase involved in cell wall biosynthesis
MISTGDIRRIIAGYLQLVKSVEFDASLYQLSAMRPTGWWKLFPRLHYALFNNSYRDENDFGFHKKRGYNNEYDEAWYLQMNQDVAEAVTRGDFKSGLEHYKLFGISEGRFWHRSHPRVYEKWIAGHRASLTCRASTTPGPLISVLMPTYNPKKEWMIAAIESVRNQLYQNWELCVADDASDKEAGKSILSEYARKESRIKVVFRETNGHISEASNSALAMATGDWVALMDHDDFLAPDALAQVAECIRDHPTARLIYSDEDKIDEWGVRHDPHFKPDWNQDLFCSYNMVSHLGVYHKSIIEEIGGFRKGYEGAQDYDLTLRFIEKIQSDQIKHIPKVLYHWRVHPESTAGGVDVKPYAMDAGQRALQDHFQRTGSAARVELDPSGYYRVRHPLPKQWPLVSIIIPTHNAKKLLKKCIDSILGMTEYNNYEIVIVDNRSIEPGALRYLKSVGKNAKIRVTRNDRPFNYSALNNAAVSSARGDILCFLNNDIEIISEGWLSEMVSHAVRADIGAVGAKLLYPNGKIQHAGIITGLGGVAGHAFKSSSGEDRGYMSRLMVLQNYSAVTGACLVIEREKFLEVGGFDEMNLPVAFNDVDLCLKLLKAGYRNLWTPFATLYHHESATRGDDLAPDKIAQFTEWNDFMKQKWGALLKEDPAYNPNFTLEYEDFSLAWPPRIN